MRGADGCRRHERRLPGCLVLSSADTTTLLRNSPTDFYSKGFTTHVPLTAVATWAPIVLLLGPVEYYETVSSSIQMCLVRRLVAPSP